jgi:hypothetical protein
MTRQMVFSGIFDVLLVWQVWHSHKCIFDLLFVLEDEHNYLYLLFTMIRLISLNVPVVYY